MTPPRFTEQDLRFVEPRTEAEWDAYHRLRWERLRRPLGLPLESVREDPMEPASTHRVLTHEDRVIAATCWTVGMRRESGRRIIFVRWRQLAVDPAFEGRGLGGLAMEEVRVAARSIGATEVVGNPRIENVPWFKRNGWVVIGDGVKLFDQVESLSMVLRLH